MVRFVLYTGATTCLSALLDLRTAYQWCIGLDPGHYVRGNGENHRPILPVPSAALSLYMALCTDTTLDYLLLPLPALGMACFFISANPERGVYDYLLISPALLTMRSMYHMLPP